MEKGFNQIVKDLALKEKYNNLEKYVENNVALQKQTVNFVWHARIQLQVSLNIIFVIWQGDASQADKARQGSAPSDGTQVPNSKVVAKTNDNNDFI